MDKSVTVIIPTLNNIRGLEYLQNYFKNQNYPVVIINNKKVNLGFAGGVNKGAKDAQTKWLLILNDDIQFIEKITNYKLQITNKFQIINNKYQNTVEKLTLFAKKNKLDAVTPILKNPDGKVENYGYRILPFGKIELVKELAGLRVNELDGITAACLLIKTSVFKKLGGFDESFFAYFEDVDFFIRFKKKGYKMGIAYNIEAIHNHMTTSKTMGNFKARQDMINWWRLYFKHKEMFDFNLQFIIERLRNLSGYLKATLKNSI